MCWLLGQLLAYVNSTDHACITAYTLGYISFPPSVLHKYTLNTIMHMIAIMNMILFINICDGYSLLDFCTMSLVRYLHNYFVL